ncbi:uncharacterized protein LOC114298204 isoform X2 [Camellia sinensis]|uniref:uncharacterized protein LOC114298204 isoform X2 n=1 Tax=Camellia sinensis TaxID=4442 RepID=UPI001035D446|nr:uncharacterized protein LOC114298204 isoform X2 [Camellia sinensis]XP_028098539.1 uncharacterized protein LOC114298204 isoform X2 [Camellia sinensis]
MSRTILICFEKAVYHRLDLSPRQFGLEEDFQCTLMDPLVEIRTISRGGPKVNQDWSKFGDYHRFNQEWERRHILLINYQVDGPNPSTSEIPQQTCLSQHAPPPTFVYNEGPNPSTSEVPQQTSPSEHPPPSKFVYNEGAFAGEGGLDDVATGSTTPNSTGAFVGEGGLDNLGTGSTTPNSTIENLRWLPTFVSRSPNFLVNQSGKRRGARNRRVPARLGSTDYIRISSLVQDVQTTPSPAGPSSLLVHEGTTPRRLEGPSCDVQLL